MPRSSGGVENTASGNDENVTGAQRNTASGSAAVTTDDGVSFVQVASGDIAAVSINDTGTVAVWDQGVGIVTVTNGVRQKVIGFGDPLFGSTVGQLNFFRGLNNAGHVAFFALLTDGTQGIYRADPFLTVDINIRPWSPVNLIILKSPLCVPVAILSDPTFDAPAHVDQGSLTFGRTGDEPSLHFCGSHPADANHDGRPDLICYFHIRTAAFEKGDARGVLKGKTISGLPIVGSNSVRILAW